MPNDFVTFRPSGTQKRAEAKKTKPATSFHPTAKLDQAPRPHDEPNLSYPSDVASDTGMQGHYIQFFILQSGQGKLAQKANLLLAAKNASEKAALQHGWTPKFGKVGGSPGRGAMVEAVTNNPAKFLEEQVNAGASVSHQAALSKTDSRARILKSGRSWTVLKQAITLYMPPSVKVSYKAAYNDTTISAQAVAGAGAIEAFVSGVKGGALTDWGKAGTAGKAAGESVVEGAAVFGAKFLMGAADIFAPGAAALAQVASGVVIGSKMELLFEKIDRREFTYTFTFIPKSADEAIAVAKIIHAFKINMLPEYMGGKISLLGKPVDLLKSGSLLVIPNAFDIQYMYLGKENPWINKVSSCYLQSMDVEYGGDKFVTYPPMAEPISGEVGPPPQRTIVSLSFKELEILTRESAIGRGY